VEVEGSPVAEAAEAAEVAGKLFPSFLDLTFNNIEEQSSHEYPI
jgi:hypothetical protein